MNDQRYGATKREQTSSNVTLIVRFFRRFRGGRTAHKGLVNHAVLDVTDCAAPFLDRRTPSGGIVSTKSHLAVRWQGIASVTIDGVVLGHRVA